MSSSTYKCISQLIPTSVDVKHHVYLLYQPELFFKSWLSNIAVCKYNALPWSRVRAVNACKHLDWPQQCLTLYVKKKYSGPKGGAEGMIIFPISEDRPRFCPTDVFTSRHSQPGHAKKSGDECDCSTWKSTWSCTSAIKILHTMLVHDIRYCLWLLKPLPLLSFSPQCTPQAMLSCTLPP